MSEIALHDRKNACVILVVKPKKMTPLCQSRLKNEDNIKGYLKYCVKV